MSGKTVDERVELLEMWCAGDEAGLRKSIYVGINPDMARAAHLVSLFDTRMFAGVGMRALAEAMTEAEWDDVESAWYCG